MTRTNGKFWAKCAMNSGRKSFACSSVVTPPNRSSTERRDCIVCTSLSTSPLLLVGVTELSESVVCDFLAAALAVLEHGAEIRVEHEGYTVLGSICRNTLIVLPENFLLFKLSAYYYVGGIVDSDV